MKDLLIRDGDLVVSGTGDVEEATGPNKIIQDLTSWLMNPIGFNRFHKWAGSGMEDYIGQNSTAVTYLRLKLAVEQALSMYYAKQYDELKRRVGLYSSPQMAIAMAEPDSIVESWRPVIVTGSGPTIRVEMGFRTVAGSEERFAINIVNTQDVASLMAGTSNARAAEEPNS